MRAPAISGRHDDAHTAPPHYVRILVPERPTASRQVPNPDTPAIRADARPQRAAKPVDGMRFLPAASSWNGIPPQFPPFSGPLSEVQGRIDGCCRKIPVVRSRDFQPSAIIPVTRLVSGWDIRLGSSWPGAVIFYWGNSPLWNFFDVAGQLHIASTLEGNE